MQVAELELVRTGGAGQGECRGERGKGRLNSHRPHPARGRRIRSGSPVNVARSRGSDRSCRWRPRPAGPGGNRRLPRPPQTTPARYSRRSAAIAATIAIVSTDTRATRATRSATRSL